MRKFLDDASGERMPLDDYRADFQKHFWSIGKAGFWKLERQQTFAEPGNESWEAFAQGRWDEAMRRLEARRPSFADYYRRIARHGFGTYRVRVIEEPITPYLRWELSVLRMRCEYGARVRVVRAEQVRRFEEAGPLPEAYTLGTEVMYEAVYDDEGVLRGAIRYTDRDLVARCRQFIQELYGSGDDLRTFFDRSVRVPELQYGE
jgi:hypothetical protein